MRVFISWSQKKSQKVGIALHKWLPAINNHIEPWLSSEDIGKGTTWLNELMKQLAETDSGIVCVTRENLSRPWLNFEAGALGKAIGTSRVWPVLADIEPTEVGGPIASYQMTTGTDKDDMFRLAQALNSRCDTQLPESRLAVNFEMVWEKLSSEIERIAAEESPDPEVPKRRPEDLLGEVLERVRELSAFGTRFEMMENTISMIEHELRMGRRLLNQDNTISILSDRMADVEFRDTRLGRRIRGGKRSDVPPLAEQAEQQEFPEFREFRETRTPEKPLLGDWAMIRAGDSVKHRKYGRGLVLEVRGDGRNSETRIATIQFDNGEKAPIILMPGVPLVKLTEEAQE